MKQLPSRMAGFLSTFGVCVLSFTFLCLNVDSGVTEEGRKKLLGLEAMIRYNKVLFPSTLSVASSPLEVGSDATSATKHNARSPREVRSTDGSSIPNLSKRIREFVGKRRSGGLFLRPFRGQPTLEDHKVRYIEYPFSFVTYNPYMSTSRRVRQFVGETSTDGDLTDSPSNPEYVETPEATIAKRTSDSEGKRDGNGLIDKRIREFVGKRNFAKRVREFAEKREGRFWNGKFSGMILGPQPDGITLQPSFNVADKRIREFVGKRGSSSNFRSLAKRIREFVGKRSSASSSRSLEKRIREFVGKRGSSSELRSLDKRIREFVGKRGLEEVLRSAPPTRSDCARLCDGEEIGVQADVLPLSQNSGTHPDNFHLLIREEPLFSAERAQSVNKRIREFVGKRSPEPDTLSLPFTLEKEKRAQSLGDIRDRLDYLFDMEKRSQEFDREREKSVIGRNKRIREFVGKRDFAGLDFHKRIREFVGKRDHSNLDGNRLLRDMVSLADFSDLDVNKRIREFVGKRD